MSQDNHSMPSDGAGRPGGPHRPRKSATARWLLALSYGVAITAVVVWVHGGDDPVDLGELRNLLSVAAVLVVVTLATYFQGQTPSRRE